MKQVDSISIAELTNMAKRIYGELVKAVVDVKKGLLVVDAELHADEEAYLLDKGSDQQDIWGINLYPARFGQESFIDFDSMINVRPSQNNMTRGVEDEATRKEIIKIVNQKITK